MSIDVSEDIFDELSAGDGILGAFFTLLWTKATAKRQHLLTGIYVPDTIIYQYSKPLFWYFTAKDGTVKRKLRTRLNCGHIEEQFLKHGKSACSVVGQHITTRSEGDSNEPVLTYATRSELRGFLQGEGRAQRQSGLFQLFFDPKPSPDGTLHNSLAQAVWSPNCFVIDKRVNRHKMKDEKVPLNQRLATFDDYSVSASVPTVSTALRDILFDACSRVAEHIEILFSYRVAHLVICFKVDSNDTPWLQWCSSLRISQWDNPHKSLTTTLTPAIETSRQRERRAAFARRQRCRALRGKSSGKDAIGSCPLCERKKRGLAKIPRHAALFGLSVLDHFHDPATQGTQFDCERVLARTQDGMPPRCVALLCPEISGREYQSLRTNQKWQQQDVKLCGDCLSTLIRLTESIHVDADGQIRRPFGGSAAPPRRSLSAQALRECAGSPTTRAATSLGPADSQLDVAEGAAVALPPLRGAAAPPRRGVASDYTESCGLSEVPTSVTTRHSNLALSGRLKPSDLRVVARGPKMR
eukprot:TRINITY_DN31123_c0_g1_i1.p1 TRINITY_DN31123_c0_g1~~TRINITY_DN31123_c0_g1_i1.p1  ORF type:complete len:525 (+),score=97.72 TRINITY_DN31123_c0_g1_i1:44-1618(+)